MTVLDLDKEISRVFGQERARLSRIGQVIGDINLLIASTAIYRSLTVLTTDRDFERVENLDILPS